MLGTRIILMGLSADPQQTADAQAEVIAAANHQIPLFWLLLFTDAQLRNYKVSDQSSEILTEVGSEYPVLVGDRQQLLMTLAKRKKILQPHLTENDAGILKDWLVALGNSNFPYLALDTYELWSNMAQPQQLETNLRAILADFERFAVGDVEQVLAKLIEEGNLQSGSSIGLTGFGW